MTELTPEQYIRIREIIETFLQDIGEPGIEDFTLRTTISEDALRRMQEADVPLDVFLSHMPDTIAGAVRTYGLLPEMAREIEFAAENTGMFVQGFADEMRGDLLRQIVNGTRARLSQDEMARRLFDTFDGFNRDWRMIAVTETNQNHNNGVLMTPDVEYFVGQSYPDACRWCRENIHGKILRKVPPPKEGEKRNWDDEIWVGKSNFGRSQSLYTRDGRERADDELWKPAAIAHPNCRCYWEPFDPDFQVVNEDGFIRLKGE